MAWECDNCGTRSTSPPCDECGHEHGEYTGFVWVCTECGKQAARNNPPCVRCGNMDLAKRKPDYAEMDAELAGTSWLEVAKPFAPVIVVMLLVAALFVTGVIPLPWNDGPAVTGAPGNGTTANGIDLAAVEDDVRAQVNTFRQAQGNSTLGTDETIQAMASFDTRRRVVADTGQGSVDGQLRDFEYDCSRGTRVARFGSIDGNPGARIDDYENATVLADAIATTLLETPNARAEVLSAESSYAVDVYVGPDGRLYVSHVLC
ncbi:hypothetical protein [Haloarchaeobius sp. DFWS5]|uniref:hypothetical protein n=1 Tax=Haloarchaeobius sp. DFWS5 TaxID=3446114 RepID=UPI003EBC388B